MAFRTITVAGPSEARTAAIGALEAGDRFLVAVGGDALVNAIADAMLHWSGDASSDALLGVVAGSAPCDFIRTFGLPADPAQACRHLQGDDVFPIDAVRVAYHDHATAAAHFLNVAEVGLGGAILRRTNRLPASLGRARRFIGFWMAVGAFRPTDIRLRGDRRTWEGRAHNVLVGNGQYTGGGYRMSPRSWPSDGYLDVLVMKGPKSDAFTILNKAVLGEHLPHPNIVEYRCRTLSVETARPWPIQADGLVVGTTPASFEVLPQAIRLKI
jgi:diacylglycerol kinase (ATP)